MPGWRIGDRVLIPCTVGPGAFPNERFVTFETTDGPISGFVGEDAIEAVEGDRGFIVATVKSAEGDTVTVWVRGHFFTTTGLAHVAKEGLRPAA